jgi:hypothetical protein
VNNLSRDEFIAYCTDKASESFLCRFLGNIKTDDLFFLVDIGELEDELIDRYDCMDPEERKEFVKEVQLEKLKQNFVKRK